MIAPILIAVMLSSSPGDRELIDRIVAIVNDEVITLSELKNTAKPLLAQNPGRKKQDALYKDILEQMIYERLLTQQIKEAKITVSDEEVERAKADILRQNNITEDQLRQAVTARGMSMGQYMEDLKTQLIRLKIVDMKVRSRVVIPDSEVKSEFEKRFGREPPEELVHIRHLFFRFGDSPDPAEKERIIETAKAARARVTGGEDFATVAKEISQGPTAAKGGDLGEISKKGLLPELAESIKGAKAGTVTEPIITANGVHVVKLEGRRMKSKSKFEEHRSKIYQELFQREVERQMKVWLDELRAKGAVSVKL